MTARRKSVLLAGLMACAVASAFGLKWHSEASPASDQYCNGYKGLPTSSDARSGMVFVPGGKFTMGSDRHFSEERPARIVSVSSFWIDRHEVTNAQFDVFVKATGYVTVAERPVDASKYPGAQADLLKPGGLVFHQPETLKDVTDYTKWWRYTPGAYWRQPEGPGSSIADRMNHPVVQITYEDAQAYAQWAKRDLPTEAEWEYASRGGIAEAEYVWGSEKTPSGKWQANVWQGRFPVSNMMLDGYQGTSPVGCFSANGYGLFDMAGNVWEITSDDYRDLRGIQRDMKVVKGGSHLCADNYCFRYRPAARQPATTDVGTSHIGFRTVARQDKTENGK